MNREATTHEVMAMHIALGCKDVRSIRVVLEHCDAESCDCCQEYAAWAEKQLTSIPGEGVSCAREDV